MKTNTINSMGIDFGTSNSSVGYVNTNNLLRLVSIKKKTSQPSYIFIRNDGYSSVGLAALKDFLEANKDKESNGFHFIPSIKPGLSLYDYTGVSLPVSNLNTHVDSKMFHFSVESLASYLIKDLKIKAEKESKKGISNVILGRPVVFSENKKLDKLAQDRLEKSAKLAGFKKISFMYEPVAAALHYSMDDFKKKGKNTVFVFDFGGGTLDTCILKLNTTKAKTLENLNANILATHGIRLGGSDLDKDIFQTYISPLLGINTTWGKQFLTLPYHIFSTITGWHFVKTEAKRDLLEFLSRLSHDSYTSDSRSIERLVTVIKEQSVYQILTDIEKTKISLSRNKDSRLINKEINVDFPISRMDYEDAVQYRMEQIRECIKETLSRANLKQNEISVVLKVGGSSHNFFVNKILKEYFKNIEEMDVFTNAVSGLALAAKMLYG